MSSIFPPFSKKDSFPVCIPIMVQWGEMDAFAHVNNIVYFRYFETARIAYFERMGIIGSSHIGPMLAKTSCSFLAPLTFPDTAYATANVEEIQQDRFVMRYGIYSGQYERLVAKGSGTIVPYDYKKKRKTSFPQAWIEQIKKIESI